MVTLKENTAHCRSIAKSLEDYTYGAICRCSCGNEAPWEEFEKNAQETEFYCSDCGTDLEIDELETVEFGEYFDDVYAIEYVLDGNKNYRSVILTVAYGGPNIYINTQDREVQLFWWNNTATYPLTKDVVDAIDEYFEEYYECTR